MKKAADLVNQPLRIEDTLNDFRYTYTELADE